MARACWLIDGRGLARKVKNAGAPSAVCQIEDCGVNRQCPNCQHLIDNTDVSKEWPGLPAGVKFDPSDVELLQHLAAKCGTGDLQPHIFIDEFIPTLEGGEGICYTHPENLPGAKKNGSSIHFFYKISNAYTTGQRKRRRVQDQENIIKTQVRWHKTGKTKPVIENGIIKGFKKIMVLYARSKTGSKAEKCNWVMHQYHLGTDEDEKDGVYVVSKIFYQPQNETNERNEVSCLVIRESDMGTVEVVPKTPKTNTPEPPSGEKTPLSDCGSDDYLIQLQEMEYFKKQCHPPCGSRLESTKLEYATSLAGESEADGLSGSDSLLCNEMINSYAPFDDLRPNYASSSTQVDDVHQRNGNGNASYGIDDLDNLELDTQPDFQLKDLQFSSQDSLLDWFDQL